MSLNWNLSKIEGHTTLCWERRTQAQLNAEGEGETLEGLVSKKSLFSSDWSFPQRGGPLERLADTAGEAYIERMHPVTNVLLMATMGVDLGSITAENYVEFYARVACLEKINGTFLRVRGSSGAEQDRPITLDEVKAHIGLQCNVMDTTWFSFSRKAAQMLREKVCTLGSERDAFPSVYAQDCVEGVEALEQGIENLTYLFTANDPSERKLERLLRRTQRIREQLDELVGEFEEIEAVVTKQGAS